MGSELYLGDCLEIMKSIPDKSVDLVLTDPPYGTTACKWDNVIPFEPMWKELKRIRKDNAAIVLFGSEPFSSRLRMSNIKEFKYDWYLKKDTPSGFLNAKKQPLRSFEIASVFNSKIYYPQKEKCEPFNTKIRATGKQSGIHSKVKNELKYEVRDYKYPKNIIEFKVIKKSIHPTQKPVALLEYIIKTYTLEDETVLDFTMGSGSTGVACKNLNRNFIGIEKDEKYFEIAKQRIYAKQDNS